MASPSNRLATIGAYTKVRLQIGQTGRQRSDSIGRSVLQTIAQKQPIASIEGGTIDGAEWDEVWEGNGCPIPSQL